MNMVFLGPPGAGKGTIAKEAKVYYSIPHISTGDLFRAEQEKGTELGNKVKSILKKVSFLMVSHVLSLRQML